MFMLELNINLTLETLLILNRKKIHFQNKCFVNVHTLDIFLMNFVVFFFVKSINETLGVLHWTIYKQRTPS